MRQSNHTRSALEEAARMRISHIRHTKGEWETRDSDRIFAVLAYERFLKPRPDVASSEIDKLHRAFIDKTLEGSLLASAKATAGASLARKAPDRPARDLPTPNPTSNRNPSPNHHREDNADPKDSEPKNPDKNA
jgi:hypothetical protein